MIKIENVETCGWDAAIRGMRNPKNSWAKSDSHKCPCADCDGDCPMVMNGDEPAKDCEPEKYRFCVGENDFNLMQALLTTIECLNSYRELYLETRDKKYWWQLIQLLPSSYNQRRTWDLNYAVLRNIYHARKNHKLGEWRELCAWIKTLPYSELITVKGEPDSD